MLSPKGLSLDQKQALMLLARDELKGFTFQFASLAEMLVCIDTLGEETAAQHVEAGSSAWR